MAKKQVDPTAPRLRVSQVWRDEVMAERVLVEPGDVTFGQEKGVTFPGPELNLPPRFTMFRHGERGYLVTLGRGMAGELHINGRRQRVSDLAADDRADGSAGAFRALAIAPGDWGVIHLDGRGEHTVFFQFVEPQPPLPQKSFLDEELVLPAGIFSIAMHAIILVYLWYFNSPPGGDVVFPVTDALAGILVNRPEKIVETPMPQPQAGTEDGDEKAPPASAEGKAGKSGGEGEKPREREEDPGDTAPVEAIRQKVRTRGVLAHSGTLARVGSAMPSDRLGTALSRLKGPSNAGAAGYGSGKGTGVGVGEGTGTLTRGGTDGPGGGGTAHADVVTQKAITTGGTRAARGTPGGVALGEKAVKVAMGTPEGDFDGLTRDQVMKVVAARRTMFQACYEKELQRLPNLSGKVVVFWNISATGTVTVSRIATSNLGNAAVESCLVRRVKDLKFPASADGRDTDVKFPFVFNPH